MPLNAVCTRTASGARGTAGWDSPVREPTPPRTTRGATSEAVPCGHRTGVMAAVQSGSGSRPYGGSCHLSQLALNCCRDRAGPVRAVAGAGSGASFSAGHAWAKPPGPAVRRPGRCHTLGWSTALGQRRAGANQVAKEAVGGGQLGGGVRRTCGALVRLVPPPCPLHLGEYVLRVRVGVPATVAVATGRKLETHLRRSLVAPRGRGLRPSSIPVRSGRRCTPCR